MELTRREFVGAFAAVAATGSVSSRGDVASAPGERYSLLRAQLKAFFPPGYCRLECQDRRQLASVKAICAELDAWASAHPGFDALDLRRESYLAMRRHFVPILFTESPFYCECGVNGGWSGARPARHVNELCGRFYARDGLIPKHEFDVLYGRIGNRFMLCCGPFSDDMHHLPPFRTILKKGFRGVRDEVADALARCPAGDAHGRKELETALVGLDTIHEIQLKFAAEAKSRLEHADGLAPEQAHNMQRIADAALRCPWEPPQTFYEGLNALWFVREVLGYVDGVNNYALGRMDAWLDGLYRADLAAGRLTREEARDLVSRFLLFADAHESGEVPVHSGDDHEPEIPLTLGGCDADGVPVWNELTRLALDCHLALDCVFPKLHCRISEKSPAGYLRKIGELLMAGHAVFALFNDDRTIPQFVRMGYSVKDAREYTCCGCWDPGVDSLTDMDSANYVSVARILEATIRRDAELEAALELDLESVDGKRTFDEVRDALYGNFIRFFRNVMSRYTRYGAMNAKVFPHPVYTMCIEGGIASRRDTTEGGVSFRPRVVTLAFLANVVDSLCAIRKLCFEDRTCTLPQLLDAVRANWAGADGARLRKAVLAAPYWGDDSAESNGLMKWWIDRTADDMAGMVNDQGGPYVLATWIYREFLNWGTCMKATPDGRFDGEQLAQGFAPSELRCTVGATTVLNAIGSLDHGRLYASNANLAFEKNCMNAEIFEAVFRVVCRKGMHLLQPNCLSVAELKDAQVHPERHRSLMVKICGFTARFVSLDRRWQDEIIRRHLLR